MVEALGLDRYYAYRALDRSARPLKPETGLGQDVLRHITQEPDGTHSLALAIDGLHCGACVWLIESALSRHSDLLIGRVNMTTRRLRLAWRGEADRATEFTSLVERLGFRLVPYDAASVAKADNATGRRFVRALAVAGFAASNVMLLSLGTWFGLTQNMGEATRSLMHFVSALIALPAIAYAGQPFFRSAWTALRHGHTNMDVPISVGVLLVCAMSTVETLRGGVHTYFDSALTLQFFLLIGRVLDHRARGRMRATAEQLLLLQASDACLIGEGGSMRRVPARTLAAGDRLLVALGERLAADGIIESGQSSLDASLVTGESEPQAVTRGARVFAGMMNVGSPIVVQATAVGEATLLAEVARLIDAAQSRRGRYVQVADRVARFYTPAVHAAAAMTFAAWLALGHGTAASLLAACSVLIVTCPCALALALPAVQVIATSRLLRDGILARSPTGLERLAEVDTVVFDKTGTLTEPSLVPDAAWDGGTLAAAASLAVASRHALARALVAHAGEVTRAAKVCEHLGLGLEAEGVRLGSATFCGIADSTADTSGLWFVRPGCSPVRFAFREQFRPEAAETVAWLKRAGLAVKLLSGDREEPVRAAAQSLGIADACWRIDPARKCGAIEDLRRAGRHVLMVGDGLNDGPALAAAHASMSPATAADVSQAAADFVFQGRSLAPVADTLRLARRCRAVARQNLAFALSYNALMIPLAMLGQVTPWIAAAAMSTSSLCVVANSFRAAQRGRR